MRTSCILVTGGAGFIGSALSAGLSQFGLPVIAFDNLLEQVHPSGVRPPRLAEEVTLIKADVRSADAWDQFFQRYQPDIVVHLAAETGTAQSLSEASRHASVNVTGTTEMLDAMVRAKIVPGKIVLASSRAVYGEGLWRSTGGGAQFYPPPRSHAMLTAGLWSPTDPEGRPAQPAPHAADTVFPRPTSIYGATKLAQEHVLLAWASAFSVPLIILRMQNVYGAGQSPFNPYTGIINVFHRVARTGQAIEVYEDGDIGRDFIYIDDVVEVFIRAMKMDGDGARIYDVGLGQRISIREAADIIARMHGAAQPVICGKFRDGDVRSAVADITKLQVDLQFEPRISFETGAKLVGDWLVENGYA